MTVGLDAVEDVFRSELRLPPRVYIVAPGPNGRGHYGAIAGGATVIAVSKAVLIREVRAQYWLMTHGHQDWFERADAGFEGVRVFSSEVWTKGVPSRKSKVQSPKSKVEGPKGCRYYRFDPPEQTLEEEVLPPIDGCIRYGATVSACAVQFAYNFGAREIALCGVDLSGDGYYDGTLNVHPHHGETWGAAERFNRLIRWLEGRGVRIWSLSPTKLDVPVEAPAP